MSGHRHFMSDVQATDFDAKSAAGSALVVGQIQTVVGSCSLTRPGVDPFQAKPGDPICRGDILETTAGGKIGIRFIDGTAFNLTDSARAVVKEFGGDGAEPSALFDISHGTFAFIAGEMAKHGRLRIETPFASIRGRAQSGGIGMLSLASLFFAALDNAQGATTPPGPEDGIINIRDSNDIINAPFANTVEEKVKWLGTARARLGYLPTPNLLTFVNGGFAYGEVERSGAYALTAAVTRSRKRIRAAR